MIRGSYFFVMAFLMLLLGVTTARADGRVALVIGNGKYQNAPFLPNPANDAADVTAALKRLGFSAKTIIDTSFDEMRRALREFGQQARDADMAVVFFAGHGMEIGGENWLIPVDAELRRDSDAENEAIGLRSVTLQVASARQLGLVILDACRNNPFAANMNRALRTRAVERGFVRIEPLENVLVAYAAKDGTTASDGGGRNSPFTVALLKHIETPGLEIQFIFRNVRDDVLASTRREQQPFVYGSLSKQAIYLKQPLNGLDAKPGPTAPSGDAAAQAWTAVQNQAALVVPPPIISYKDCGEPTVTTLSTRTPCPLSQFEEQRLKAKDIFKECEKCPEMVIIPAGQFKMGSIHGERGRSFNEQPRHEVTIGKMFAIGKLHVTVDQFRAFVTETGYTASKVCRVVERDQAVLLDRSWNNPNFVQTDLHPVVCITKRDAQSYIDWLRKKTGKHYRLLSEAEWEYAARAGTTTRYYFGDDEKDICRYGNSRDMRARRDINDFQNAKFAAPCDDGYAYTSPVGSFSPNDFGLYDMLGNASTFVEDCWNNNYIGAPIDGSPWKSGYCVENTVARGGNWIDPPDHTRSASRINQNPLNASAATGLRVARSLEP